MKAKRHITIYKSAMQKQNVCAQKRRELAQFKREKRMAEKMLKELMC